MLENFTISNLQERLLKKDLSAYDVTKKYIEKIKKEDKKKLIYLTLNEDEALASAKKIDKKINSGEKIEALSGIPTSIKDVICTKGLRTTAASRALENYIPPYDATVVTLLKKQGAIILGKTNCDEFAMGGSGENSAFGVCQNPFDNARVPGGSSSGSAVAVSKNLCVYSLGSDTGGSVRLPASFCGICGMKPTYGRISRYGLIAMASSLDQIGIIAKNTSDVTTVLNSIAGQDKYDSTSSGFLGKNFGRDFNKGIKGLSIAYDKISLKQSDSRIGEISETFLRKWEKAGGKVKAIEIPFLGKEAVACYYIITTSEVSSNMARYDGTRYGFVTSKAKNKTHDWKSFMSVNRGELLGREVKRRIITGTFCLSSGYYDAFYGSAQKVRLYIKKSLSKIFGKYPLIYTPVSPDIPFKIGERVEDPVRMYLADAFTTTANLAGIPAIAFPIGKITVEGKELPIGGQLMANQWDEETLLRGAYWGEKIVQS